MEMERVKPNLDKPHRCPRCHSLTGDDGNWQWYYCYTCRVRWFYRPYLIHYWWRLKRTWHFSQWSFEVDVYEWGLPFYIGKEAFPDDWYFSFLCFHLTVRIN